LPKTKVLQVVSEFMKQKDLLNEWHARAAVRFCDLGGWTDTRIVPQGAVLNFGAVAFKANGAGGGTGTMSAITTHACAARLRIWA
jgi:hypothetical protein